MKILHVLYQSLPNKQGTSIRSRDILRSQKQIGLDPIVVTSPFQRPMVEDNVLELLDDVKFYRTYNNTHRQEASDAKKGLLVRLAKSFQIIPFTFKVLKIAKKENVDVIHAHATFFTGIAGKIVAKLLRKRFVYEVRSLWEEGVTTNELSFFEKIQREIIKSIENFVCNSADHVIVINDKLREQLNRRGVKVKISVVPNAFFFAQYNEDAVWPINRKGLKFGFIGNINFYEGLELLINAASELGNIHSDVEFLVWGNGADKDVFLERIKGLSNIKYQGLLSPDQIHLAYDQIDVVLNPRLASKLTENVTPLKPVEAMGYKKLIIASDIGGMREIINHEKTGLLFTDRDLNDFVEKLKWGINEKNHSDISRMITEAYKYVFANRNWRTNALKYQEIYSG